MKRHRNMPKFLSAVIVLAIPIWGLTTTPAQAKPRVPHLSAQQEKLDHDGAAVTGIGWPSAPQRHVTLKPPVWPAGGTHLRATAGLNATVVDRASVPATWRAGVVAKVTGTPAAKGGVTFDYSGFRSAYGGDWASRLRLWRLPDCALTTPGKAGCTATELPSSNNTAASTVTADAKAFSAQSAVVALAAAPNGPSGDFTATPLQASTTWSSGGNSGGFSWSYPLRTPPAIAGTAPKVTFSYSSASVDGRSSATNNQTSWLGEGFEYSPGFIERRYVTCEDDKSGSPNNPAHSYDDCWRSQNATLSLNGASSELVYEAGKGWHARTEDGAKIERLTGATNGDNDGEYWKVTATDGTQYFFGLNKLPGQTSDTNSALNVPVYGNHAGEPCHADKFSDSRCDQAWRWNLDYAVDTHGNTISYWYDKESNRYAAEGDAKKTVPYDRGSQLTRIDYGTWDRGAADRSVKPLVQVTFAAGDRCLSGCTTHDADHWPDTPWDQQCTTDTTSCQNFSPTYWTTKRLTGVTTRVWDTTRTTPGWQDVDSYALTQSFPSPGDGQKGGLWLASITHTGLVGGATAMPPVTFDPVALPNRVLTKTNTTNNWQRLAGIHTETGALVQITYSTPQCSAGNLPSSPQANDMLCYPVIGPDPLSTSGGDLTEWWQKYVVQQVSETDVQLSGAHQAPTKNTYYTYGGKPAWHYADDDGLTKPKYRTWSDFRGYSTVDVRIGDATKSLTRTTYLRGMNGDKAAPSGGTRSVTVPASLGSETVPDEDQYAGMVREQAVFDGSDDKPVSKTVNVPWRSSPTATRTIGDDTVTSRFVDTQTTYQGTALGVDGSRGWRVTSRHSTFDDTYGTVTAEQDNGDVAKSGDEKCTTTAYNRNTDANLVELVKQVTVTTLPCGTAPTGPDQVVSDDLTFYDGATSAGTAATKGDVTRTDMLNDWSATAGTIWLTTKKSTFDAFGRSLTVTDPVRGNTTTSAYTPASGLLLERTDTTQQGWVTTTDLNPAWSSITKTKDPNGRTDDATYDPLGRVSQVWESGWTKADHPSQPAKKFTYWYSPDRNDYPYVKTEAMNSGGGTDVTFAIYDGLLRPRQTQTTAVGGGRVVTDTQYDERGHGYLTFDAHAEPGAASGTLYWVPDWSVPSQNRNVYDAAGRVTDSIFLAGDGVTNLVEKWRTTTSHEGDRTTVVPPAGGTAITTLTDVDGHITEKRQYDTAAGVGGAYLAYKYAYNAKDQLSSVIDSAGDQWTYKYDVRGRQIESVDPDKGKVTTAYNDAGDETSITDARGSTIAYTYDSLGRQLGAYTGAVADANKRIEWVYDKLYTGATELGQLTQTIRWDTAADGTRQAYKWQVRGFDKRDHITGEQYVVPSNETGLGGTYIFGHGYSPYTGAASETDFPAAGGLADEAVTTKFDATSGLATELDSAWSSVGTYVVGQQYTAYKEPTVTTLKINGGVYAEQSKSYDGATRRLSRVQVKPETSAGTVADRTYSYDNAGNIVSVADAPAVGQYDNQCYKYDQLRRLTSAWTPAAGVACSVAPSVAGLGGAASYWLDWTIDDLGNRTGEVQHTAAGDTTRSSALPVPGLNVARPHGVTGVTTTAPGQNATTDAYAYDAAGNMTSRPGPSGATQTITWDAEGKPVRTVEGGKTTTSVYDPGGARLIQRDSTGSTLYLPGMEVHRTVTPTSSTVAATRYYTFNGDTVASRTPVTQSLTWLFSDNQGTESVAVNAYTQQTQIRRQTPYGGNRGGGTWLNDKGFVGGQLDSTGLILVGARYYDTALGRFISVDPIQDLQDPAQWNAYQYSNNSPITFSDPTGTSHGSASCTGGMVGGPGACDGHEDPNYSGPPVDDNGPYTATSPSTGGGNNNGGNGNNGNNGGGNNRGDNNPPPKPKKHHWWDKAADFVSNHAGAIVGTLVGVGCTVATGGAGLVACGALGAFVGSAISNGQQVAAGKESWLQAVEHVGVDTVVGAALGGLSSVGGKVVQGAFSEAAGSVGSKMLTGAKEGLERVSVSSLKENLKDGLGGFVKGTVKSFAGDAKKDGWSHVLKDTAKLYWDEMKKSPVDIGTQAAITGGVPYAIPWSWVHVNGVNASIGGAGMVVGGPL